MNTTKGTDHHHEEIKKEGSIEKKVVDTVDYRSPAGEDKEPTKEEVQVIHLTHDSSPRGGALAGATAAVANTVRSAKEAILGPGKDTSTTTKP